jgi:BirA family transcriptional regulator, biotin operon repressor / biotin---[acetyl-CoA-carboxylase] ligase
MLTSAVLGALAPGQPVSGAVLAQTAGVTRAAIWKQVETLRQRGLPIQARVGGGYHLPWPVQLLDEQAIRDELPLVARQHLGALEVHWELDSTSSELQRRLPGVPDFSIVLAESQTAGRGRRGKAWISPPGLNVHLSVARHFDAGFARLSGLSLAVGVMVVQALQDLGIHTAGLKWPNDVLAGGAKLAGVLVELSGEFQGPCTAVIGVGLNMRVPDGLRAEAGQPVTDLATLCGGNPPDRNLMVAALIARLMSGLERFEREGFPAFVDDYAQFDLLAGEPLRVIGAQEEFFGVGAGIDGRGALLVRVGSDLKRVDSADVSVRRT